MADNRKNTNELIPAFGESLKCDLVDIGVDFTESTIDSIIDNPILDSVPLIKVGKSLINSFFAIREKNFLKNALVFLQNMKNGKISESQLNNYKLHICKSDKAFKKEFILIKT